jgi:hypothetical protein
MKNKKQQCHKRGFITSSIFIFFISGNLPIMNKFTYQEQTTQDVSEHHLKSSDMYNRKTPQAVGSFFSF